MTPERWTVRGKPVAKLSKEERERWALHGGPVLIGEGKKKSQSYLWTHPIQWASDLEGRTITDSERRQIQEDFDWLTHALSRGKGSFEQLWNVIEEQHLGWGAMRDALLEDLRIAEEAVRREAETRGTADV